MGRDTGIGIGLLVLAGLLYWQAGKVPVPPFVPIGPAFYPRAILVLLASLSLWLILEALIRGGSARPATRAEGPTPNRRLVLLCFAIFAGYIAGLSLLGYLLSTGLFVLALSWAMGPRSARELPKLLALAIGTTLATYMIFEKYLHVFLPQGRLF
jgi:putative tricarboxylic transport membrane protein